MNGLMCPISNNKADENVARVSAVLIILLVGLALYFSIYDIIFILGIDFYIRGFASANCSFVAFLSKKIVKLLKLKEKPIDLAPKKFAAKIGMIFAFSIVSFQFFNFNMVAYILGGVLLIFSFLEASLGFCVGFFVYTMYIKLILKK